MSERAIQNDILVAITALPGAFFWRANTGAAFTESGRVIKFNVPGTPDILGCYRGQFIGIEVKSRRGTQRQSQERFQTMLERAGGRYIVARSVAEALIGLTDG